VTSSEHMTLLRLSAK